jgi:hypothetical protein
MSADTKLQLLFAVMVLSWPNVFLLGWGAARMAPAVARRWSALVAWVSARLWVLHHQSQLQARAELRLRELAANE